MLALTVFLYCTIYDFGRINDWGSYANSLPVLYLYMVQDVNGIFSYCTAYCRVKNENEFFQNTLLTVFFQLDIFLIFFLMN